MALVIEDGTRVAGATSFVTSDEVAAYAIARGRTWPATHSDADPSILKAMDYLESLSLNGAKVAYDQALSWPRTGMSVDGTDVPENVIPAAVKRAQMHMAMEIQGGYDPMPTTGEQFITKEQVGPIVTEYSEKIGGGIEPVFVSIILSWLRPFLSVGTFGLRTVRV